MHLQKFVTKLVAKLQTYGKSISQVTKSIAYRPSQLLTLCLKKNVNDVAHYNFNAHQPILIIFGRDIAE